MRPNGKAIPRKDLAIECVLSASRLDQLNHHRSDVSVRNVHCHSWHTGRGTKVTLYLEFAYSKGIGKQYHCLVQVGGNEGNLIKAGKGDMACVKLLSRALNGEPDRRSISWAADYSPADGGRLGLLVGCPHIGPFLVERAWISGWHFRNWRGSPWMRDLQIDATRLR